MAQHPVQRALKDTLNISPIVLITLMVAGCATVPNPNPADPWERMNRGVHAFNEAIDGAVLKPVSLMYQDLTPKPVRTCVGNIFNNLGDVWSALNSFLQGRGHDFLNTLGRVLFNSTVGLGGCIDVASTTGATRIENDFGVTLGVWGVGPGPYVVLPFLGASSVRDGVAMGSMSVVQAAPTSSILALENVRLRNTILGFSAVDARTRLIDADRLLNEIALDRYSFIRDAYLQKRQAMIQRDSLALPDYEDDDFSDDGSDAPANANN